jgi:hypothetical protein
MTPGCNNTCRKLRVSGVTDRVFLTKYASAQNGRDHDFYGVYYRFQATGTGPVFIQFFFTRHRGRPKLKQELSLDHCSILSPAVDQIKGRSIYPLVGSCSGYHVIPYFCGLDRYSRPWLGIPIFRFPISGTPIVSRIPISFLIPKIPVRFFMNSDVWRVRKSEFRFQNLKFWYLIRKQILIPP